MITLKEVQQILDDRARKQKRDKEEYGMKICKQCNGTKNKIKEQKSDFYHGKITTSYSSLVLEHCNWCNDYGMVDPWNELMGKKWCEYVHKMY